jgi:hypothetical protein
MFRLFGLDESADGGELATRRKAAGAEGSLLWRTSVEILKLYAPPGALKWREKWQPALY